MPSTAILASAATWTRRMACTPPSQSVGLLLMDSSLNPISCNDETIRILSYPELPKPDCEGAAPQVQMNGLRETRSLVPVHTGRIEEEMSDSPYVRAQPTRRAQSRR